MYWNENTFSSSVAVKDTMLEKTSDKERQTGLCSDCGCSFSPLRSDPDPTIQQKQSDGDSLPKCPSCLAGDTHPNGQQPQRHVQLDPHICNLCNKTFISSAHLALHLSSHNKERKFRCSTCGKYFHQSAHLIAHRMTHSGDRPFKCPECGKTFVRASHLTTHRRLHTGEKPFKCTFCDKSFTQKAGLLSHIRLHKGERPSKCVQCGLEFQSQSLLLSHKAQEACKKAESESEAAIARPQQTHESTDDLKCGVCCRTFVRSSYIKLHVRLKKGQRPYHCKVCNKTFVKLDTFVNHCEKHLKQKKDKNKLSKGKVVKPPLFVPLSRPTSPAESSTSQTLELNTRSKSKAKTKTEHWPVGVHPTKQKPVCY